MIRAYVTDIVTLEMRTALPHALLVGWTASLVLACSIAAQETLPVPVAQSESDSLALEAADVVRAAEFPLAVLRIPASMITAEASREYRHTEDVDRVVLGTHSRGTAVCQGQVTCQLSENRSGAEFVCHIVGSVVSQTCGENGPAIISSMATTDYSADKRIYFDGRRLSTQPAALSTSTHVEITGIDSTLPRLRGRIVRSVARRRAAESLPQAEAITRQLTSEELQRQIDQEFEQRIASLNQKLAQRLSIIEDFTQKGFQFAVRSSPGFVEVVLTRVNDARPLETVTQFPLGSTVDLWIPLPQIELPEVDWSNWGVPGVARYIPPLLLAQLQSAKAKIDAKTPRLAVSRHENWLGFHASQ